MRTLMIPLAALAMTAAAPAFAQNYDRQYERQQDRAEVSRGELRENSRRLIEERQDLRQAQAYGTPQDIRRERRDVRQATREARQDSRDWQRGRQFSYNRPDPRYNGYYADNYYRGGAAYRPYRLSSQDRIYRGRDNRYYCRRNDGTTGLIVGALGGGVLGNVIAPGGSRTLGAVIGGGLGAVLGNSIDRNNVTCR